MTKAANMLHRLPRRRRALASGLALLAAAVLLSCCAYPVRNQEIATLSPSYGYRWHQMPPDDMPDTLVIVTASGGGTRAAVLELSVLEAMNKVVLPNNRTLADEIKVLSSVSGGSVTAAYFAAHGTQGFGKLETFLRQDGIAALVWRIANPVGLAEISTPAYERIDPLINYFDEGLFDDETYQSLLDDKRRPYLILNAGDMVEGVPFPFTQRMFDTLCSDLSKMKLSTAVAASAAFPVALSPVTLKNYSPCAAQAKEPTWPPLWVTNAAASDWESNPDSVTQGRVELAYAQGNSGPHPKKFIHLLDGGIADNLGVTEPYRLLTGVNADPAFINDIRLGNIKKIIFVMINARSAALSSLDGQQATPGMLDMLSGTLDASIDRSTAGAASKLRGLLQTDFASLAQQERDLNQPEIAARFDAVSRNTQLISIDFDAIQDSACRQAYHSIATSWTLDKKDIDGLMVMGEALLAADSNFPGAVAAVGGTMPRLASVTDACNILTN